MEVYKHESYRCIIESPFYCRNDPRLVPGCAAEADRLNTRNTANKQVNTPAQYTACKCLQTASASRFFCSGAGTACLTERVHAGAAPGVPCAVCVSVCFWWCFFS